MNVTTRGRYAVTALLDLAQNNGDQPVPLAEIARRQDLSLRYLEQIFCRLRGSGLVESVRGACGGYRLCRAPQDISVADVIAAVETDRVPADCAGPVHQTLISEFWSGLSECMRDYLQNANLASLCDGALTSSINERSI